MNIASLQLPINVSWSHEDDDRIKEYNLFIFDTVAKTQLIIDTVPVGTRNYAVEEANLRVEAKNLLNGLSEGDVVTFGI